MFAAYSLHFAMASGGDDVATEAALINNYYTYTDVQLLRKRWLEEEGAATARKALSIRLVHENTSQKRARSGESLHIWFIGPCNLRF